MTLKSINCELGEELANLRRSPLMKKTFDIHFLWDRVPKVFPQGFNSLLKNTNNWLKAQNISKQWGIDEKVKTLFPNFAFNLANSQTTILFKGKGFWPSKWLEKYLFDYHSKSESIKKYLKLWEKRQIFSQFNGKVINNSGIM